MSTSPKIYLLKNAEGKFVSVEAGGIILVQKLCYARYTKSQKEIEAKKLDYEFHLGCKLEIHVATEEEFMEGLRLLTTKAVLSGQYFRQLMENINYNLPTVSQINKNLRNSMNNSISKLEGINSVFKHFEDSKEDTVYEVYGYYMEMIEELVKVELHEVKEVTIMLKAREKNRSSMLGIAKKVLNH